MHQIKYFLIIFTMNSLIGAYLKNIPTTLSQPNGEYFDCLASGDEFYLYLHTEDGYTIIQNRVDGYFYYAFKNLSTLTYFN